MAFDENQEILVPFRTWRNTNTAQAAAELSELFVYNIPLRWSISHLYQAILNGEEHVKDIKFLTTLAGYIHWQLTRRRCSVSATHRVCCPSIPKPRTIQPQWLRSLTTSLPPRATTGSSSTFFPRCSLPGENAGTLTEEGAKRLDISGHLNAGVPVCPPEGDAGTEWLPPTL